MKKKSVHTAKLINNGYMRSCLFFLFFIYTMSSYAQVVVDRLVLKDGSVLNGYISKQVLGKSVDFVSFCAEIVVDGKYCNNVIDKVYEPDKIPASWKDYFQSKDSNLQENVTLSTVSFVNYDKAGLCLSLNPREQLQILERGYKYLIRSVTQHTFTIKITDIERVEKIKTDFDLCVLDEIVSKDQTFRGSIQYSVPSKYMQILDEDGIKYNVSIASTLEERKYVVDKDFILNGNNPYFDVVLSKDKKEVRGIIKVKYYGDGSENPYIIVMDEKGRDSKHIPINEISEIRKEPNLSYKDKKDSSDSMNESTTDKEVEPKETLEILVNGNLSKILRPVSCNEKRTKKSRLVVEKQKEDIVTVYSDDNGERKAKIRLPKQSDETKFVLFEPRFGKRITAETFETMDYETRDTNLYWYSDVMSSFENSMKFTINTTSTYKELIYDLNPSKVYLFLNTTDNTCVLIKTN